MTENLHFHLGFEHPACTLKNNDVFKAGPISLRLSERGGSWVRCPFFSHPRQCALLRSYWEAKGAAWKGTNKL